MVFNSVSFAVFFAFFLVVYHFLLKSRASRLWCIVAGSLIFYAGWNFRYIPVLLGTALIDFALARLIESTPGRRKRLLLVWASVCTNLGVLAYFKYTNFFIGSAYGLLNALGLVTKSPPFLDIVLPVGISFYTFQSMSYVIDVYRGDLRARRTPKEFLAGVTFFPHLVAGPIIRSKTLLPQFDSTGRGIDSGEVTRSLLIFFIGLTKKGLADILGAQADLFYGGVHPSGLLQSWLGTLAFTGQIYADFSGYTDMAIGAALLLGFRLPPNFNYPYIAPSLSDFWRRWHISLSSWIRDYVFTPLAVRYGSSPLRLAGVALVTMLLFGLWHGAQWTFVAFGAYHGVLLILTHILGVVSRPFKGLHSAWVTALKAALTFYAVHLGWVLFRAPSLASAARIIQALHSGPAAAGSSDPALYPRLAFVLFAIVFSHVIGLLDTLKPVSDRSFVYRWATVGATLALGIVSNLLALGVATNGANQRFIYFQF